MTALTATLGHFDTDEIASAARVWPACCTARFVERYLSPQRAAGQASVPRAWPVIGHIPHLLFHLVLARGSLVDALQRLLRIQGSKTLALRLGPVHVTATVDPGHAHRILMTDAALHPKTSWEKEVLRPVMEGGLIILDGTDWERHHRAVARCFRPASMHALVGAVADVARSRLRCWRDDVVDVGHEMRWILNGAMFRFFLGGLDLDGAEGAGALDRYCRLLARVEKGLETRVADRLFLRERVRARLWPAASFWRAVMELTRPIMRAIEGRCPIDHDQGQQDDALAEILRALPADEAAKEIRTLFAAGATTGHLLTWLCDALSRDPELQARLRAAIVARLGSSGEPALTDLEDVPYLTAVIQEGLRLFPPAPYLIRRDRAFSHGYQFVSIVAMHRDPDLWPRPNAFEPERWLVARPNGEPAVRSSEAFLPFGAGPRVCIGKRFALIEIRMILVELLRRFELIPADRRRGPKPVVTILTRPRRPVALRLRVA